MWKIYYEKLAEHLHILVLVCGKCNGVGLTEPKGGRPVNGHVGPQDNGLLS